LNPGHVALVLAAGGSRRLGRPKQLLMREGETLVHRAVRLAAQTSPARLLVVLGAHGDAVRAALGDLHCEAMDNPHWRDGLGSSLHAAAPRLTAQDSPVLVLACDQPALDVGHLHALIDASRQSTSQIAATRYGHALGVPAVVPAAWFQDHDRLREDRGFGRLLRSLPPADIAVLDAPELGLDIDTESDIAEATARGLLDADDTADSGR